MKDRWSEAFAREMAAFFGRGRCFLLAKGRVGLYAGLRAMQLPPGSTVLMPGYTCMVVPSAVQYAGLRPTYVDIDPKTYNLDPRLLEQTPPEEISAVIVQHTYGIPCDMGPIQAWAAAQRLPIIEDCCHSFGSGYGGQLCGTFGALAFFSGQWNKPFSTGLGGMLLVNDAALADRVGQLIRQEGHAPGTLRNLLLAVQIVVHSLLFSPRAAARLTKLYRLLNRWGLVIGSSTEGELHGRMGERYFATMARCQAKQGVREMARIAENTRHRQRLAALYHRRLGEMGLAPCGVESVAGLPLLRYPVRVGNKEEVLRAAAAEGFEIGSWFEVPLHPAGTDMESLGYRRGMCPEAEKAAQQVVNLPTHRQVDDDTAERTLDFLRRRARPA